MDLEALMVERAEEQLKGGAWRDNVADRWRLRGVPRCDGCGVRLEHERKISGPSCPDCKRKRKRKHCWACDAPAEVRGYCRNHWDQVISSGVVDSLHISAGEGHGAPKGGRFA